MTNQNKKINSKPEFKIFRNIKIIAFVVIGLAFIWLYFGLDRKFSIFWTLFLAAFYILVAFAPEPKTMTPRKAVGLTAITILGYALLVSIPLYIVYLFENA